MNFNQERPIYLQLYERLCDSILASEYEADARVPSVREYATALGVNINTALKAYDELSRNGVLYQKRGLGYFVSPDARRSILQARRTQMLSSTLPEIFRQIRLLELEWKEIEDVWKNS